MSGDELRAVERMLAEARALRAAYPDGDALRRVSVGEIGAIPPGGGGDSALRAALVYLRDEMLVVRGGKADSLVVLDDEIANVERLMRDSSGDAATDAMPLWASAADRRLRGS